METKTKRRAYWIVGLAAGAAAVAGITYAATQAHASSKTTTPATPPSPSPSPLPSNTPSGNAAVSYTLPPGQSGQTTVAVAANGYVTLFLPQGGTWNSLTLSPSGTQVATSGNQAATFQVTPTTGVIASATAVWTDAQGNQYTDVISLPTS